MFVVFTIMKPDTFPTYTNLIAVVNNQTITAVVALGLLVPLAAGVFDISIGGVLTLSVIFSTLMFQSTGGDMPVPVVIALTLLIGVLAGLFNGILVVRLRIEPFIVTLGSGSIFLGISQLIAHGQAISEHIPTRLHRPRPQRTAGHPGADHLRAGARRGARLRLRDDPARAQDLRDRRQPRWPRGWPGCRPTASSTCPS